MAPPQKPTTPGLKDVLKGFACGSVLFGVPIFILATIVPIVFGQDVTFRAHQTTLTVALWEGKTYTVHTEPNKVPEFHPITITWIKLDNIPPIVPPVVPDPVDPVDPPIPPPNKISQVVIVRESADATPATARLIVGLRSGPSFDYLKSKGHTVFILDDDSTDSTGKPPKILTDHSAAIAEVGLPCVLLLDGAGKLVTKAKLPESASAVVDLVKANGG